MQEKETKMRRLVEILNRAAHSYYVLDNPTIGDSEYDKLYDELVALEKETGERLLDSPTRRVGGEVLPFFEHHRHLKRLWSMDKCQSMEELRAWCERMEKLLFKKPCYYVEYKFDGLTLNLTYENGLLQTAATRGNGEVGEMVLSQAKTVKSVPLSIPYKGLVEVHGECIMKLSVLENYNKKAADPLKNARNAAAGALRNLDPAVTATRNLSAYFYEVGAVENPPYDEQAGMIGFLKENGFPVSPLFEKAEGFEELQAIIEGIERMRHDLDFLIDGAVVKVADMQMRETLGYTDKFPRWAIAYKFKAEETVTVVREVTWELGRTGKLTPLAHLDETDFMGVTVKKATLNNYGDILRKGVAINCPVWIRRSNDVIPEIMGRVGEPEADEINIEKPLVCPACGGPILEKGAHLFCMNRATCKPQAVARIAHFAARNAMDIEGFSEKTAEQLYDELNVRDSADLYTLALEPLLKLEGFKEKKAQNLLDALQKSRNPELDAFLFAIGVPNVGRKTARDLAKRFKTLKGVQEATEEELLQVDEVGEIVAKSVVEFFSFEENRQMIERLLEMGVRPKAEETEAAEGILKGMSIVVTGTLLNLSRKEAEDLIVKHGGNAAGSVSKKTAFVVAGEAAGSKLSKAQSLSIPVLTEAEFLQRIENGIFAG
jgi:DNA ligase, NAD-dependent